MSDGIPQQVRMPANDDAGEPTFSGRVPKVVGAAGFVSEHGAGVEASEHVAAYWRDHFRWQWLCVQGRVHEVRGHVFRGDPSMARARVRSARDELARLDEVLAVMEAR